MSSSKLFQYYDTHNDTMPIPSSLKEELYYVDKHVDAQNEHWSYNNTNNIQLQAVNCNKCGNFQVSHTYVIMRKKGLRIPSQGLCLCVSENDDFKLPLQAPVLQRSCTMFDCHCNDIELRPCSTYNMCVKCHKDFIECKHIN
jgi:hypothetical protein